MELERPAQEMTGTQPEEDGPDADNRGRRATIAPSGAVHGSGAGAGGGGAPEDIDSDPASGSGADMEPRVTAAPDAGADAPKHGGR